MNKKNKVDDKAKQTQIKKEVSKELKKAREDSNLFVLRALDLEYETVTSVLPHSEIDSESNDAKSIDFFLTPASVASRLPLTDHQMAQAFYISNFIHTFHGYLGIDSMSLESFFDYLRNVSAENTLDNSNKMEETIEISSEAKSTESNIFSKFSNDLDEKIIDKRASADKLLESLEGDHYEIAMEKFILSITRIISSDLLNLLDTNEVLNESIKKDKSTLSSVNFPVNQLTWQEIMRMVVISNLLKEADKSVIYLFFLYMQLFSLCSLKKI
jgi:hypothetical protein